MSSTEILMLAIAAAAAGAINSVAGGGSLISWPAAVATGLSQVVASATNTVALAPASLASAWAYRRELGSSRRTALLLCVPAACGALAGATLLFAAPPAVFESIVPWLVLGATIFIVGKDFVFTKARGVAVTARFRTALVGGLLALVAIYGGYFGAGLGIITLAVLGLLGDMDIHRMNAMKNLIAGAVNSTAALYFIALGRAELTAALAMACGSIAGGFGGASLARRVDASKVRWVVFAIGMSLGAILAYRRWG
jgi:uncharacterized membrane protein YfcA